MSVTQKRTPHWSLWTLQSPGRLSNVEHLVNILTNILMRDGKKTKAQNIVKQALTQACQKTGLSTESIVLSLSNQIRPLFGLRSLRLGGSSFQVPFLLPHSTGVAQGFRWLIEGAQRRQGKMKLPRKQALHYTSVHKERTDTHRLQKIANFANCLAVEIEESLQGQSFAITQRKERHKRALANRQYSHYARW